MCTAAVLEPAEAGPGTASLEFLPYHRYGENKYKELGMDLPDEGFGTPTQEQLDAWKARAAEYGIHVVSYR